MRHPGGDERSRELQRLLNWRFPFAPNSQVQRSRNIPRQVQGLGGECEIDAFFSEALKDLLVESL